MAFWNRKKKREKELARRLKEGETDSLQQKIDENMEKEVEELFKEVDSSQKRVQAKEDRRKKKREKKAEEELYETEIVLPKGKADQKRYVTECCENIRDVDHQIDAIRKEYEEVTNSLLDIQKIERIEREDKKALKNAARNIIHLTKERNQYKNRELTIPDSVIRRFEPFEEELVSEIKRMYEGESYQKLIDQDLELLHKEKKGLRIEQSEIVERQNALKGLARGLCAVILVLLGAFVVLYLLMEIDLRLPYLATISLAAVSAGVIFVESQKNRRDMSLATRKLDKTISLLNRVKIKCVNNLNLLEYNRQKFGVSDAASFEALWQEYCKAKEYERRFRENTERLNLYSIELRDILKEHALSDAEIWVSQAIALIDNREMVEIRHTLNQRRQLLRERTLYNENTKRELLAGIDDLIGKNPENREELLEIVQRFS
ncbi:MAG: hypothetical protein IJ733_08955 [Lachnospiraceae bacterium]|nr:hypothetical protein [Lachnospiraceae bacterium]